MKRYIKYIGIFVLIILISVYYMDPIFKQHIQIIFGVLCNSNIEQLKEYILSFGIIGPIISIILMILQAVVAPLPSFIITFANSYIYGWKFGMVISCIGTYLGATLCFGLSRIYGRPMAERFVPSKFLDKCNSVFDKYGKHVVYASRLLPFISFDGVSYAAGLTEMSFKFFSIATIFGQIPITFVVSKLGQNIYNAEVFIPQVIICAVLAFFCMIGVYIIYRKRYNGKSVKLLIRAFIKKE